MNRLVIQFFIITLQNKDFGSFSLNGFCVQHSRIHLRKYQINYCSNTFSIKTQKTIKDKKVKVSFNKLSAIDKKDNPVPNRIQPRKQPGIYMIKCLANDWRYYGESSNVSGRLASHCSMLKKKVHPNNLLQKEYNLYESKNFDYIVLYQSSVWESRKKRIEKEIELINQNQNICYNIYEGLVAKNEKNPFFGCTHTEEAKHKISQSMKSIPRDTLGRKIIIKGTIYPSIAEASRQTNIARKTIRQKVNDRNNKDYTQL